MDNIDIVSKLTYHFVMIQVLTILPEQYNLLDDSLEIRQIKKDGNPEKLIQDDLHEKLSDKYACIIDKEEHKSEIEMG